MIIVLRQLDFGSNPSGEGLSLFTLHFPDEFETIFKLVGYGILNVIRMIKFSIVLISIVMIKN